MFYYIPAYS
jgi:hypothetical protein